MLTSIWGGKKIHVFMEEMTFEKQMGYLQVKKGIEGIPRRQRIKRKMTGKCELFLEKCAS